MGTTHKTYRQRHIRPNAALISSPHATLLVLVHAPGHALCSPRHREPPPHRRMRRATGQRCRARHCRSTAVAPQPAEETTPTAPVVGGFLAAVTSSRPALTQPAAPAEWRAGPPLR
jgi:hypothetical protein